VNVRPLFPPTWDCPQPFQLPPSSSFFFSFPSPYEPWTPVGERRAVIFFFFVGSHFFLPVPGVPELVGLPVRSPLCLRGSPLDLHSRPAPRSSSRVGAFLIDPLVFFPQESFCSAFCLFFYRAGLRRIFFSGRCFWCSDDSGGDLATMTFIFVFSFFYVCLTLPISLYGPCLWTCQKKTSSVRIFFARPAPLPVPAACFLARDL